MITILIGSVISRGAISRKDRVIPLFVGFNRFTNQNRTFTMFVEELFKNQSMILELDRSIGYTVFAPTDRAVTKFQAAYPNETLNVRCTCLFELISICRPYSS
jgi:hypothetical protein